MNVEGFTHRIVLGRRRQDARSHRRQRPRARPDPRFSADLVGVAPHDAAACRHTVVAVDLRGAGHSDKPQGGYDKASLAADVHGVMTAWTSTSTRSAATTSAPALALTHRDAVTRLTVLDASQPGWSRWMANSHEQKVWQFAFHMKRDPPELLIRGREFDYVSTFIYDRAGDLERIRSRTSRNSRGPSSSPET